MAMQHKAVEVRKKGWLKCVWLGRDTGQPCEPKGNSIHSCPLPQKQVNLTVSYVGGTPASGNTEMTLKSSREGGRQVLSGGSLGLGWRLLGTGRFRKTDSKADPSV